jgi:hypothetical protein
LHVPLAAVLLQPEGLLLQELDMSPAELAEQAASSFKF